MGLDMYLYAEKFVSNMDYCQEQDKFNAIVSALEAQEFTMGHVIAEVEVAYWRKANAIHGWFMQLTDRDDCSPVYVDKEKLFELTSICQQILDNPALAPELLPTQEGFFFGGTGYDEWYMDSIKETHDKLSVLLGTIPEGWSFKYQASW
jgi:hypothetical protein